MTAADTGNVLFAGTALQAQEHFAIGTFEILVVPAVFHAFEKLTGLGFPAGCEFDILSVLSYTLIIVSGKHPVNSVNIQTKPEKGKDTDSRKTAQQGNNKTRNKGEHAEVVRAVTALHETDEGHFDSLQEGHFIHSNSIIITHEG